jgi:chromosome transmission fidelity protein 18
MNVLGVSYIDPTMDKCYAAHEWLSDADLYRHGLESHMPATAGAVHLLCRVEQRPNLTFTTRKFFEAHCQLEANQNLLRRFAEGVSPDATITRGNGCVGLTLETIPYSLWMLSAGEGSGALDRPVTSVGLLNGAEADSFLRHANILTSLGLAYQFSSAETSDRPQLQLEPPIDRFARYSELKLSQDRERREVSSSVRFVFAGHTCKVAFYRKTNSIQWNGRLRSS